MENIKEQAKKFADDIWEEKLNESFDKKIKNSFNDILDGFKKELENYDNSINNQFQELDKQFNNKWAEKFTNEISKLEQIENQSNINDNDNKNINNLNQINNNNNINELNQNKNNNLINENKFNKNINKNNFDNKNIGNNIEEKEENLRNKIIDFNKLKNPPLINITYLQDMNPLINIILLCISNIKYIPDYYLNPTKELKILKKSKEIANNINLNPYFLNYLDQLWKSKKKEFCPIEIHNVLKKLMLQNYYTNDAGIIIDYILKKLNEEFNIITKNNNIENIEPFEHFDKEKVFKKSLKNFMNIRTYISDIFYSTIKIKKLCQNCKTRPSYYFEFTPIINIYLEENNNIKNLSFENNLQNLLMTKEKNNIKENCIICSSEQTMNVIKEIISFTAVLIIYINRENDPKNNIFFKYPEIFEGNKIINNNKVKMPNYELTAIIKKVQNNNYISFYKNFVNKLWYSYDNQKRN